MSKLQKEILREAIELLDEFPNDLKVVKEQSKIIRRILRELISQCEDKK